MKKILGIILCAILIMGCDNSERSNVKSSLGYYYTVDTISGHIYIFDSHGMQEYPECPKCKENLKETVTEVVDSIVDSKVVEILGK